MPIPLLVFKMLTIPVPKDNSVMKMVHVKIATLDAKLAVKPVLVKYVVMISYGFKKL